jgi:LysR family transcriptional regulator of abg operon
LKLHHLRDFVAIARANSLRGAARDLGLAQPALTRSLRELEAEIGSPLLERHARGTTLTPSGTLFLAYATGALTEIKRGQEAVAQLRGEQVGSVCVGLSSVGWLTFVPQVYTPFRKAFPGIHLRMSEGTFSTLEARLHAGTMDFYVGPRPDHPPGERYQITTLFQNELAVLCGVDHPLRDATRLRDLIGCEWLLTGVREAAGAEFEQMFTGCGLSVPKSLTHAESMIGVSVLLSTTHALAVLPHQWGETPVFKGVVQSMKLKEKFEGPDIVQITRTGLPLTPAAAYLATLIERAAASIKQPTYTRRAAHP